MLTSEYIRNQIIIDNVEQQRTNLAAIRATFDAEKKAFGDTTTKIISEQERITKGYERLKYVANTLLGLVKIRETIDPRSQNFAEILRLLNDVNSEFNDLRQRPGIRERFEATLDRKRQADQKGRREVKEVNADEAPSQNRSIQDKDTADRLVQNMSQQPQVQVPAGFVDHKVSNEDYRRFTELLRQQIRVTPEGQRLIREAQQRQQPSSSRNPQLNQRPSSNQHPSVQSNPASNQEPQIAPRRPESAAASIGRVPIEQPVQETKEDTTQMYGVFRKMPNTVKKSTKKDKPKPPHP